MNQARWWLAGWTALIVLAVCPWTSLQDHAHWSRVTWVPFLSPEDRLRDVVVNLLLYVPGGYLGVRAIGNGTQRTATIVALAAALSLMTEASQLYSHGRFPSATDFTCNILGAFAGARKSSMKDDR